MVQLFQYDDDIADSSDLLPYKSVYSMESKQTANISSTTTRPPRRQYIPLYLLFSSLFPDGKKGNESRMDT
jgi:hypothetical protein